MEAKITVVEDLVDSIETNVSMDRNISYIENDSGDLANGSYDNIFLRRQKKS